MDIHKILVYFVTGCLLVVDHVSAYFNQTFNDDITFILSNVSTDNNIQGQTSLTNAQNWCQSRGYTLAKIPDDKVQKNIQQFITNAIGRGLMYGNDLIILNGKLIRSLTGTWMWVNGQPINGIDIQDEPPDLNQGYFYGYLKTSDFKLHASSHNNGKPYICEKPGNDCAGGQPLNGRCYERKMNSVTWYSARYGCVEEGGDLASFETLNDDNFNSTFGSTLFANAPSTEYWVGMQRVEWRWEDTGLPIKYTKWETGAPSNKPTQDCLSLRVLSQNSDWLWFGYGCSQTYRFICMATNRTTPLPTSPTSSDASSTKSTSGSVISKPTSPSLSMQPTSNSSASHVSIANDSGLALGLGLGIGLGVGALLVVAIVLAVIFIRRRKKNKSNLNSKRASSGDATAPNGLKESDIDAENIENNGTNKYDASTGSASPGAIYATVQSSGTLLPPTNHAKTDGAQTVYADFDLVQKP